MYAETVQTLAELSTDLLQNEEARNLLADWQNDLWTWRKKDRPMPRAVLGEREMDTLLTAVLRDFVTQLIELKGACAAH